MYIASPRLASLTRPLVKSRLPPAAIVSCYLISLTIWWKLERHQDDGKEDTANDFDFLRTLRDLCFSLTTESKCRRAQQLCRDNLIFCRLVQIQNLCKGESPFSERRNHRTRTDFCATPGREPKSALPHHRDPARRPCPTRHPAPAGEWPLEHRCFVLCWRQRPHTTCLREEGPRW